MSMNDRMADTEPGQMTVNKLQCNVCAHRQWQEPGYKCDAFPEGIPKPILMRQHDHRLPYPGDSGIRWEYAPAPPLPGAPE